ncbi:phage tail-collar fiber domain-containing protein [Anaerocolumna sp. MB42-C2]|uniref:phage tail-collar fiber domain-containing protein n=1 Tax=Anaerocolumna sp. MB42-C2 TaxID=3070997 RepID=UPI0027DFE5FF|nr:phage tail protein [Anaerocolumna sp. MB42-C2]WMJ88853.1 phage tail protein [Anaerocolumna sp. MB42-C2]
MSFSTILFTEKGRALQAKALAGAALNFTKIAMGSGTLGGQNQITLTKLIEPKVILTISDIRRNTNYAEIKGTFTNQDISTGFYWREIGLFAQDPDIGEILYCYGNAGTLAEYIPPQSSEIIEKVVNLTAIVGDAANVTATINESLFFATKADVAEKWEIVISDKLPEVSDRKENTLYFKITDTVNQGVSNNIVVSPTMGLKIEE